MKKVGILSVVLLVISTTAFGQGIGVGIKGGVNFARIDLANASTSYRTSYHLGAFAKFIITGKIGIRPEAYYSIQGTELNSNAVDSELSLHYFQVPILLEYSPISILNIHAGPQFGFLLRARDKTAGIVTDIEKDLKKGDFMITAGVGVNLPMGLSLALRYVKGLSDISEDIDSGRSNMFQVSVGYQLFNLGK